MITFVVDTVHDTIYGLPMLTNWDGELTPAQRAAIAADVATALTSAGLPDHAVTVDGDGDVLVGDLSGWTTDQLDVVSTVVDAHGVDWYVA